MRIPGPIWVKIAYNVNWPLAGPLVIFVCFGVQDAHGGYAKPEVGRIAH